MGDGVNSTCAGTEETMAAAARDARNRKLDEVDESGVDRRWAPSLVASALQPSWMTSSCPKVMLVMMFWSGRCVLPRPFPPLIISLSGGLTHGLALHPYAATTTAQSSERKRSSASRSATSTGRFCFVNQAARLSDPPSHRTRCPTLQRTPTTCTFPAHSPQSSSTCL